ncbi:MAG: methyltransferase [Chitinophagaceae bacterium]
MDLINPLVQQYAEQYSSPEDELLKEVAEFTLKNHPEHHMLSGHLQGKFLEMISCLLQPKRILEIGTFTGYSALCLAKGLSEDGLLHTIEIREKDAGIANDFFLRSVHRNKIILHTGSALEILPALNETWDLVFIDADKTQYVDFFNLALPKLRKNGVILADNIFFHGQVLEQNVKGKSAKGIQAFNNYILQRNDIEKLVLTLRDGLYLIRKP